MHCEKIIFVYSNVGFWYSAFFFFSKAEDRSQGLELGKRSATELNPQPPESTLNH